MLQSFEEKIFFFLFGTVKNELQFNNKKIVRFALSNEYKNFCLFRPNYLFNFLLKILFRSIHLSRGLILVWTPAADWDIGKHSPRLVYVCSSRSVCARLLCRPIGSILLRVCSLFPIYVSGKAKLPRTIIPVPGAALVNTVHNNIHQHLLFYQSQNDRPLHKGLRTLA